MKLRFLILYSLILLVFVNSSHQFLNLVYAQSNNVSDATNIDTEINDLLNKIGRGNIIDSTIDSLMQGMGSSLPPSSSPNSSLPPSSSPNSSPIPNTSSDINNEIISILKNQDSSTSTATISQSKNQDMKYFAKIVDKYSKNENIISSNSLTEFNNDLLKFCLESGIDYYSCSSIIQDSLQAAQFTNSYMGPAKVNTDLIGYLLELKIR
ncbi:MAG TPA: hypothetical protein VFT83_01880 [Nitrososphaeraceae archaeon]|nr:hypothetical protein [Nitrososphaeraceae archaeon]